MLTEGDTAPTFSATVANGDVEAFDLADHLDDFEDAGATVVGVSADSAFSLNAFRDEHGIAFDLVSDMAREAIGAYDLEIDIGDLGLHGVVNRAVFVLDDGGVVTHAWVADDPTNEPDYGALLDAVAAA